MTGTIKRIVVIGLGGIGGALVGHLALWMNSCYDGCEIVLIDGDRFQKKNRDRQLFTNVNEPKAEGIAKRLRRDFSKLVIRARNEFVTNQNIDGHIQENDIVFLCVDGHKTRQIVSNFAETLANILVISGGNELTDGNAQAYEKKNDVAINLPIANEEWHPEIAHPEDKSPDEIGCSELAVSEPQLYVTNVAIAADMLKLFYRYLSGQRLPEDTFTDIDAIKTSSYFRS